MRVTNTQSQTFNGNIRNLIRIDTPGRTLEQMSKADKKTLRPLINHLKHHVGGDHSITLQRLNKTGDEVLYVDSTYSDKIKTEHTVVFNQEFRPFETTLAKLIEKSKENYAWAKAQIIASKPQKVKKKKSLPLMARLWHKITQFQQNKNSTQALIATAN